MRRSRIPHGSGPRARELTPECRGLHSDQLCATIRAIGGTFELIGADLGEGPRGLSLDTQAVACTVESALRPTRETLRALGIEDRE